MSKPTNQSLQALLSRLFENGANAYYRHSGIGELGAYQDKKKADIAEAIKDLSKLIKSVVPERKTGEVRSSAEADVANGFNYAIDQIESNLRVITGGKDENL